jgi:hypothetical protein
MVTAIVTEVSRLSAHRHDVGLAVLARATEVATTRPSPANEPVAWRPAARSHASRAPVSAYAPKAIR